jgi:hypothetical protein
MNYETQPTGDTLLRAVDEPAEGLVKMQGKDPHDSDGTDGDSDGTDGADGDGTDGTDGDGTDGSDADGTDGTDGDGTDGAA